MKCTYCGQELQDGTLFCPICGTEVQLVPDYETLATTYYRKQQEEQKREERERKEQIRRARQFAREEALRQEQLRKKRARRRKFTILISLLVLVILGGAAAALMFFQQRYMSFPYQMEEARACMQNQDYEQARAYLSRAQELEPDSEELHLALMELYIALGDEERLNILFAGYQDHYPRRSSYYGVMIQYYMDQGRPEQIRELLEGSGSDEIRAVYAEYIVRDPEFSLAEGSYNTKRTVELSTPDSSDRIYYTLDGSEPDSGSELYREPIRLEEGETEIRAIAYSGKDIPSGVSSARYIVTLPAPSYPTIYPKSGEFTTDMSSQIYVVVPNGCTAHYAFDRPATVSDPVYTRPVSMPIGEHTFYAILVDENGKTSSQGSAIYILSEP